MQLVVSQTGLVRFRFIRRDNSCNLQCRNCTFQGKGDVYVVVEVVVAGGGGEGEAGAVCSGLSAGQRSCPGFWPLPPRCGLLWRCLLCMAGWKTDISFSERFEKCSFGLIMFFSDAFCTQQSIASVIAIGFGLQYLFQWISCLLWTKLTQL